MDFRSGFNWRALFVWSLAILTVTSAFAHGPSLDSNEDYRQKLFSEIAPSVIFISQGDQIGSGFFVNSAGLALTNHHVVKGADKVSVVLRDGTKAKAQVIDRTNQQKGDLALLKVNVSEPPESVDLAGLDEIGVGSWVGTVGHGMGGIWTFTTGMVSNIYSPSEGEKFFQTQIPVNPGASGGPVFNRDGEVVGVIFAGMSEAQNINFAIPMEEAFETFNQISGLCDCLLIGAPKDSTVYLDGKPVGKGPKIVVHPHRGSHELHTVYEGNMRRKKFRYPEDNRVDLTEKNDD